MLQQLGKLNSGPVATCETPVVKYQALWFRFQKIFESNAQKKHYN